VGAANPLTENVRRLRVARGLTQQQVADEAGLSRVAYRAIETGETRDPRVGSLLGIARALGVKLQELLAEPPRLETVRFRSNKMGTRKAEVRRQQLVVGVARWLEDFNGLEEMLGASKPYRLGDVARKVRSGRPPDRARRVAVKARKALGLDQVEPVRDICGLLESAGVKVRTVKSDLAGFFGLSVAKKDGGPAIVVNVADGVTVERRIFTAAHELGHLLLHPNAYDIDKVAEDEGEEKEADLFAGHFLVPDEGFDRQWEETAGLRPVDRILHVKRLFRVSYGTILHRLIERGVADKGIWAWFHEQCRRRGVGFGKKEEPFGLEPVDFMEDRLSRMVREALERDAISMSRAAEILGEDLPALRDRVASWELV
jgi:Zn-dependent peptidase ImmA (M78 family)/transcriptional regulator with XRE-family HTH domain